MTDGLRLFKALEVLLDYAETIEDEGPPGSGWKSEELRAALDEAEAALEEFNR